MMKDTSSKKQHKEEATELNLLASTCFLFGSVFGPEDEGNMFLRNVGNFSVYKPSDTRRLYSS
jgi:hypothetical protein